MRKTEQKMDKKWIKNEKVKSWKKMQFIVGCVYTSYIYSLHEIIFRDSYAICYWINHFSPLFPCLYMLWLSVRGIYNINIFEESTVRCRVNLER